MDKYSYLSNEARAALADVRIEDIIKIITENSRSRELFFELIGNENNAHNRFTNINKVFVEEGFVGLSVTDTDIYSRDYFVGRSKPNISIEVAYGYRIKGRGKYKLSDDIRCSSYGMKLLFDKMGSMKINKDNTPTIREMIEDSFGEAYKKMIEISINYFSDEIKESLEIIPNQIVFDYVREVTAVNIRDNNILNIPSEKWVVRRFIYELASELDGDFSILTLIKAMVILIGFIVSPHFTLFLVLSILFVYAMVHVFD